MRKHHIFLAFVLMMSKFVFAEQTVLEKFPLGDDFVTIEVYQSEHRGLTFFHPHEDEVVSYQKSKDTVKKHGGKIVSVKQSGERLIKFKLNGSTYIFDPNRIFTTKGIKNTLSKYSSANEQAITIVKSFADRLVSLVLGGLVVAVHNNHDEGYNISSYKNDGKEVKYFYQNPKQGTGEFFYTTNEQFFYFAKASGYNVVLQSDGVVNDGSFSVYAALQGSEYINIEVQRNKDSLEEEMLSFLLRYFSSQIHHTKPQQWQALKLGDSIDLIAPSSATNPEHTKETVKELERLGFRVSTQYAKSNPTSLYYDNTDEYRAQAFIDAMNDPNSKAVWAIRGGAGATRILEKILKYQRPKTVKPLIGFSDISGLHNFVNQKWNMSSLHAIVADYNTEVDAKIHSDINSSESLKSLIELLTSQKPQVLSYHLAPINKAAEMTTQINDTSLLGGNLTLVQSSIGTPFQANLNNKVLILEDIGNSAHQLERILDNLRYSNLLSGAKAVILGEFVYTKHDNKATKKMIDLVLQRFADRVDIAVFRGDFFGHSKLNHPMPLNTQAKIVFNKKKKLFMLNVHSK